MGSKPQHPMEGLRLPEGLPKAAWMRSPLGQGSVWRMSCDLEHSAEGEGLPSPRTNRQGSPSSQQLPDTQSDFSTF